MINKPINLCLVIPCYNEEGVIEITIEKLLMKMNVLIKKNLISSESRITLIDDGSKDQTWNSITTLSKAHPLIEGIKLSRNRGHQNALLAGLMSVKDHYDVVISMDADLQDDIDAIDKMLDAYTNGSDIVYGVRSTRKKDNWFKRNTALAFYKLLKHMGVDSVYNHADYRLMSQKALNGLASFKEVNLFLRGLIPMIGYKTAIVEYERNERIAGESKYPIKKMLEFAIEGITSLSVKPLRMISFVGFALFFISCLISLYFLLVH